MTGITITTIILGILFYWFILRNPKSSKSDNSILPIELIPKSMHQYNVRARITEEQWKAVCKVVHKKNVGNKWHCQVCHQKGTTQGFNHPVECHEVWEFDDKTRTQKLVNLKTLCPLCHKFTHLGLATKQGFANTVKEHGLRIRRMSISSIEKELKQQYSIANERGQYNWKLDLTYMNNPKFSFLKTKFTNDEKQNCTPKSEY